MLFGVKTMFGVRELTRGGVLATRMMNRLSHKPASESFELDAVLKDACASVGQPMLSDPENQLPDYRWWRKLCHACGEKVTSNYGGALLRGRLTRSIANRLAMEELFRLNGDDIAKETIEHPLIVMGLPRSQGHMAAHLLSRTGLFLCPRQSDTFALGQLLEVERRDVFKKHFKGFHYLHPDFLCVRVPVADQIDDDLSLHLLTPQSYAWGLLHGLDTYLLECLEENQTPVYEQVKRTLQLFQWYHRCGHFSAAVPREYEPLHNPIETQEYGIKSTVMRPRWLLFSPFAILSADALGSVFPGMQVIWVHRALSQCVPSLCSSLCLHNALYTSRPPTDSQLATMGEKVLGLFGSGSDYAIDYFGSFDQRRMAHWSNRDVKRHGSRIAMKTLEYFDIELDRYRRIQMISGQAEYTECFRPLHDAQMPYFCLHEGIVDEVFAAYIHQFGEFAFEKRLGVTIDAYKPLAGQALTETMRIGSSTGPSAPSVGHGMPMVGHFLQENSGASSR